jgi:hypothetical protein
LFIRINQPANNNSTDVIWETWATDDETFPRQPNLNQPPTWPGQARRPKTLKPSTQLERLRQQLPGKGPKLEIPLQGDQEEVRRNQPAFDYIIGNSLWYKEGLVSAFRNGKTITFPKEAIEIKAQWKQITEQEKPRYHWNIDGTGKLFGLIALHISTKDLPNWFWATFEHVDNSERGKALGSQDRFGIVPPNSLDGQVSPGLQQMFAAANLGKEWLNYRLDGSQVDFVTSTGQPTRLGNSILEDGFVSRASCITCHGRERADQNGAANFTGADIVFGTPDPKLFFDTTGKPSALQLDFVWGFLNVNPAVNPPPAAMKPADGQAKANPAQNQAPVLERLPQHLLGRYLQRKKALNAHAPSALVEQSKTWSAGQTVKVSFIGGDPELRKGIAKVASEWTKWGNLKFDFGQGGNPQNDCRLWNEDDRSEIRVAFSYAGYWSLVGTDSITLAGFAEPSLNFGGFDLNPPVEPDFTRIVLHEFGHAVGFQHEHQHPKENCGFDFDVLYRELAKPPNNWDKQTVDFNLRQLNYFDHPTLVTSNYDPTSIMHYYFPKDWFLPNASVPNNSICAEHMNNVLSQGDKDMMLRAYPITHANAANQSRIGQLDQVLEHPTLNSEVKQLMLKKKEILTSTHSGP